MKLVIFGLSISSSWGNGHATLWRGLVHALGRRGHQVVFFERDVPYYAAHRDLSEIAGGELVVFPRWADARALAARHLADADVAIVTSYCADGVDATELMLDSPVPLRAFYDLDTPVTLAELQAGRPVPYLGARGLRDFDVVFSYTGGRALAELGRTLGARRVVPLYGSVDPTVHYPVAPVDAYRADLSYLGTYAADRQDGVERFFVEAARRLPERRFLLAGAQYPPSFPWTANTYFLPHVAPPEHAAFYSSSRLTLNVTRQTMAEMGYCPSGRLFEAAACGVPLLSDSWEGLDCFFEPGSEILVAESTDDAVAAITAGGDVLARVARRARERTLDEHTAERRAVEMEAALERVAGGRWAVDANTAAVVARPSTAEQPAHDPRATAHPAVQA